MHILNGFSILKGQLLKGNYLNTFYLTYNTTYLKANKMNIDNIDLKDVSIIHDDASSIPSLEQECHLNIDRNREGDDEIAVCCSHQNYITALNKSEWFTLKEILVSSHPKSKGFVLQIKGNLHPRGLTIRTKIPVVSEELRKQRSETAKRNFSK